MIIRYKLYPYHSAWVYLDKFLSIIQRMYGSMSLYKNNLLIKQIAAMYFDFIMFIHSPTAYIYHATAKTKSIK